MWQLSHKIIHFSRHRTHNNINYSIICEPMSERCRRHPDIMATSSRHHWYVIAMSSRYAQRLCREDSAIIFLDSNWHWLRQKQGNSGTRHHHLYNTAKQGAISYSWMFFSNFILTRFRPFLKAIIFILDSYWHWLRRKQGKSALSIINCTTLQNKEQAAISGCSSAKSGLLHCCLHWRYFESW